MKSLVVSANEIEVRDSKAPTNQTSYLVFLCVVFK